MSMKAPHNLDNFRYEFGHRTVGIESIVIAKTRLIQNIRENMIFCMNHNNSYDKNRMNIHFTLSEQENKRKHCVLSWSICCAKTICWIICR